MSQTAPRPLDGRRVLIVEDRYLIAAETADEVRRMGGEVVGPAPDVRSAVELVAHERIDVGLLDVNLDGKTVFPLADLLAERDVPFVFLTGYDGEVVPPHWRDRPRLTKPIDPRRLRDAITACTTPH